MIEFESKLKFQSCTELINVDPIRDRYHLILKFRRDRIKFNNLSLIESLFGVK